VSQQQSLVTHGTAIAIGERGVLLLGPSGSGKSDLALRLIDAGALLIADDAVLLAPCDAPQTGRINAAPLPGASGRLMVRDIGIIPVPAAPQPLRLALAIRLVAEHRSSVLPLAQLDSIALLPGRHLPVITLPPFDGTSARKVVLALERWGL